MYGVRLIAIFWTVWLPGWLGMAGLVAREREESEVGRRDCGKEVGVEVARAERSGRSYNIPESLSAFCSIVSFTAAKTRRILLVSVA